MALPDDFWDDFWIEPVPEKRDEIELVTKIDHQSFLNLQPYAGMKVRLRGQDIGEVTSWTPAPDYDHTNKIEVHTVVSVAVAKELFSGPRDFSMGVTRIVTHPDLLAQVGIPERRPSEKDESVTEGARGVKDE